MTSNTEETLGFIRDRKLLTREQLLADYSKISAKRKNAAEATALRLEAEQYLEILAYQASKGTVPLSALYDLAHESKLNELTPDFDPLLLGSIGRVVLLQGNAELEQQEIGVAILKEAVRRLPKNLKSRRFRKLIIEYFITQHKVIEAKQLITESPDLDREYYNYLRVDIDNPFIHDTHVPAEWWLEKFNTPLTSKGLSPVQISKFDGQLPFDRLYGSVAPGSSAEGPLVSVVMTTYNPDLNQLINSVRSILRQTYTKLELIIVDDCSNLVPFSKIHDLAKLDDRVSVIRAEENGGTYRARNLGYSIAKGTFITGQDDDDWSHPQRLVKQVEYLLNNVESAGCRVSSITCNSKLVRTRIGYKPENPNASSLMLRTRDYHMVGGFLEARKGADTEFQQRLQKITGRAVFDLDLPLTFVRILDDSLSRSDFRAGWSHPARRQFKSAYSHWHSVSTASELRLGANDEASVYVPRRFRDQSVDTERFDVVLAGDWRQYGGPQKSMIEEIHALIGAGLKVAVMHLEAPRFMSTITKPICNPIQSLINEGIVDEVLYDDAVQVDLLILRYPPILQFFTKRRTRMDIKQMLILANQSPSERDGTDIRYLVKDCHENAVRCFCSKVTWVPQGPQVREAISPYVSADILSPFDMPGILDITNWWTKKLGFKSTIPVVGRHSRDNTMKWPEDTSVLEAVYPTNGVFDVRVLGGATAALSVLGCDSPPAAWTVYETDQVPVQTFLKTLDFFVYYQHSQAFEAFGRAILEAIASGIVVILPLHFEAVFGRAAIYAEPSQVVSIIRLLHANPKRYQEARSLAYDVLIEKFSYESYQKLILSIIKGKAIQK